MRRRLPSLGSALGASCRPRRPLARRRGFSLLEVMIATGILVLSLVVLVETQSTAAMMTIEADRIVVATQLAQEKLAEVRMLVEREGFTDDDIYEEGDFDDFGDEAVNIEFEALDDYHYEYLITQVDLELAGDLTSTASNLLGSLGGGASGADASAIPDLSGFGLGPEMLTDALDPFIREARVRVWWGDDSDEAEERGNEVVLTTHIINPASDVLGQMGIPRGMGGAGGEAANPGGVRGGGRAPVRSQPGVRGQPGGRGQPGAAPGGPRGPGGARGGPGGAGGRR